MQSRDYDINLRGEYNPITAVYLSQYDSGVELHFHVYDGTEPAAISGGAEINIMGRRPSGVGFDIPCTLVSNNLIIVSTTTDMTGEAGTFPVEIRFSRAGTDIGTVNFDFVIEKAPHPDGTIDADITHEQEFIERLEALEDDKVPFPENNKYGTAGQVLKTLGDGTTEWTNGASGQGVSDALKVALLQIAQKVAYVDEHGQDYYNDLYEALYPPAGLTSITAVYTQGGTVYDTDELDSLKADLVVTAHYDDSSSEVVTTYTLSGTLTAGESTITISYGGKTTTFTVTVTHNPYWVILSLSDDFIEQTSQSQDYSATYGAYVQSNSSRCAYGSFGFVMEAGYKYTFEHDSNNNNQKFGVVTKDADCLTAVANHASVSGYNQSDSGWQLSGYSYTTSTVDRVAQIQFNVTAAALISAGATELRIIKEAVV